MSNDKNTESPHESKTKAYQRVHGGRSNMTVRCRPEIIAGLKEFCRANDISMCHIIEACITGYLEAMKQKVNWVSQSPTIELTVVREVKRVRRYGWEFGGKPNKYDARATQWVFEADAVYNVNGHAAGCACSLCRSLER